MDMEWWKAFFEIGGVVLLFLTFAFGAGFMLTGKKVNERQAERLRTFDSGLTAAKSELAVQQERAAKAEANIALAEQHAAEANTKAEGFRLDIAKANKESADAQAQVAGATAEAAKASAKAEEFRLDIAQANERAASANETAERERLARLQLEARLADRVITPDQRRRITEAFAPMRGETVDVVIVGDTPEVSRTADAILVCLQNAGVLLNFFHPFGGGGAQGVVVGLRADSPEGDRQAGTQLVAILSETLGGGVGSADWDKIMVGGTGTVGSTPGATAAGKSAIRLQVAPK